MGSLWELGNKGLAGFVKRLGEEIESGASRKVAGHVEVKQVDRNRNDQCYSLIWVYNHKHSGDVMISRRNYDDDELTIDRFWRISHIGDEPSSLPRELREAADIQDYIENLLIQKFGQPISQHDGRDIYTAELILAAQPA